MPTGANTLGERTHHILVVYKCAIGIMIPMDWGRVSLPYDYPCHGCLNFSRLIEFIAITPHTKWKRERQEREAAKRTLDALASIWYPLVKMNGRLKSSRLIRF